jgi:hypothetical protein
MQHSSSPSQAALMARWKAWVAAKVSQTPGGYHFNEVVKMIPTGEQPQGGQAGQAGGVVIRFPIERRR